MMAGEQCFLKEELPSPKDISEESLFLIMLDGGYVDDGREIFDEDLDEKPATTGKECPNECVLLCNIKMLLSTIYSMYIY